DAAFDSLAGINFDRWTRDQVLDLVCRFERGRRRLPFLEHAAIRELDVRSAYASLSVRDTAAVLRNALAIDIGEARRRVVAAEALGPRRSVQGEPLPPLFPQVAAAQAAGEICARAAEIIVTTVDRLPDDAREVGPQVEAALVEQAREVGPQSLAKSAER